LCKGSGTISTLDLSVIIMANAGTGANLKRAILQVQLKDLTAR